MANRIHVRDYVVDSVPKSAVGFASNDEAIEQTSGEWIAVAEQGGGLVLTHEVNWPDLDGPRTIERITTAEFGLAEEVVGLMQFTDESFEVGIGESMRPYILKYRGRDPDEARRVFNSTVGDLSTDIFDTADLED